MNRLPTEILRMILSRVSVLTRDVAHANAVCHAWHEILHTELEHSNCTAARRQFLHAVRTLADATPNLRAVYMLDAYSMHIVLDYPQCVIAWKVSRTCTDIYGSATPTQSDMRKNSYPVPRSVAEFGETLRGMREQFPPFTYMRGHITWQPIYVLRRLEF